MVGLVPVQERTLPLKVIGNVLLAIGSGLGVWVITNLDSTGISDIAIVLLFILVGATFKNAKKEERKDTET